MFQIVNEVVLFPP